MLDAIPDDRERTLGVVNISGPVSDLKKVSRLRDVAHERVIALGESLVRIVAAKRPLDFVSTGENRAIKVERDSRQVQFLDLLLDDLGVQAHQGLQAVVRELTQPAAETSVTGDALEPAEPLHERVIAEKGHVPEPSPSCQPQRDEDQNIVDDRIVTAELMGLKGPSDAGIEVYQPEISFKKLKSRVAADLLLGELDLEISVDPIAYFVVF